MSIACEHCINRRKFLARAAEAAGAAALLAACGDGQLAGPPSVPRVPPDAGSTKLVITVADYPGLATLNELVAIPDFKAAKRTGPDTFDAFSMACTHAGCLIDIVNGQTFHCPCHDSRFANDGSVINGPNTGERINPLQKFPTSYDPATDKLTIG
jgi:Rieske Fe-S protein